MSRAREVIDYIAWIEHNMWVHSICDSLDTAMAVYNTFQKSASAERGMDAVPS